MPIDAHHFVIRGSRRKNNEIRTCSGLRKAAAFLVILYICRRSFTRVLCFDSPLGCTSKCTKCLCWGKKRRKASVEGLELLLLSSPIYLKDKRRQMHTHTEEKMKIDHAALAFVSVLLAL